MQNEPNSWFQLSSSPKLHLSTNLLNFSINNRPIENVKNELCWENCGWHYLKWIVGFWNYLASIFPPWKLRCWVALGPAVEGGDAARSNSSVPRRFHNLRWICCSIDHKTNWKINFCSTYSYSALLLCFRRVRCTFSRLLDA